MSFLQSQCYYSIIMPKANCIMRKAQNRWLLYLKGLRKHQAINFQQRPSHCCYPNLQRFPHLQKGIVSSVPKKPKILNRSSCQDHRLGRQRRTNLLAHWEQLGRRLGRKWCCVILLINFRCVLVNQDELQIERFTIAPALNTENIETEKIQEGETETLDIEADG